MKVMLVSEGTIKKASLINTNVDANYIETATITAQDMGLQPLIGSNLYDTICDMVSGGTISTTANSWYKTLLDDHITPYLCQKVMADIAKGLYAKFRNAGMTQSTDTQTAQLSRADVEYIVADHEQKADFYGQRMCAWLCANADHFPEWKTRRDSADMAAKNEQFYTHIVL